jgi:Beta protein
MININFEDYQYFPTLRTRQSEMRGLKELDANRKSKIIPLLTLGRWPKATDFERAAEKSADVMIGQPYFLDLTTDINHLGEQQKILRDSSGGFKAWRDFVSKYDQAIPVVQLNSDAKVKDVFRQARLFEQSSARLAFRIKNFSSDTPLVVNTISALDDVSNVIVFIDCQYIRDSFAAYVTAVVVTINQLRNEFPDLMIVVLSTSFPSSVLSYLRVTQTNGSIEILERQLHDRIGGNSVAAYGDHASIHSVVYDDMAIMRWSARIDYPQNFQWFFERRAKDQTPSGFVSAAKSIIEIDPDIGTRDIWGEQMIIDAASSGIPYGAAPSSWIAVRVNIHLSRQIDLSMKIASRADVDIDEEI